jgi:hypothetical protein
MEIINTPPATVPPSSKPGITDWIKNNKKLILFIAAVVVLFIFLAITIFQIFRDRIFPKPQLTNQPAASQKPSSELTSMNLNTSKTVYTLSEKVTLKAVANSQGTPISAFDVAVSFDSEFLSLTAKKSPTLPDFTYYGSNTGEIMRISAVHNPTSTSDQVFNNTTLFEFEFTPKKIGRTSLKIVFIPNSTNESNLIDKDSNEILETASGTEIEITN